MFDRRHDDWRLQTGSIEGHASKKSVSDELAFNTVAKKFRTPVREAEMVGQHSRCHLECCTEVALSRKCQAWKIIKLPALLFNKAES